MAGRDLVRSTVNRGFRAYFSACMPNSRTTTILEEESFEQLAARLRERRNRTHRTPRVPWGYRSQLQSPKPKEPEEKVRGFFANVCEGPLGICSICFEPMEFGDNIISLNCCDTTNHTFHEKCILTWFEKNNTTCPLCRNKVI